MSVRAGIKGQVEVHFSVMSQLISSTHWHQEQSLGPQHGLPEGESIVYKGNDQCPVLRGGEQSRSSETEPEFVAETRILAEMKIENCGKMYFPWEKNRLAYFFSSKIKMMDL